MDEISFIKEHGINSKELSHRNFRLMPIDDHKEPVYDPKQFNPLDCIKLDLFYRTKITLPCEERPRVQWIAYSPDGPIAMLDEDFSIETYNGLALAPTNYILKRMELKRDPTDVLDLNNMTKKRKSPKKS